MTIRMQPNKCNRLHQIDQRWTDRPRLQQVLRNRRLARYAPVVSIRDDHSVGVATTTKTYIHKGPAAEDFEVVNVLPKLTTEAVAFLDRQAGKPQSFFLYLPLSAQHMPIVPPDGFMKSMRRSAACSTP